MKDDIKPKKRPKITDVEIKNIIELYSTGLFMNEVADKVNRDEATIKKILKSNNIEIRHSMPSFEVQQKVVRDYNNGLSVIGIKEKYGFSFGLLKKILNNNGFNTRKAKYHTINEDYFSQIDSHQKAYWIGLIMSDGCVRFNRNKEKINKLCISLTEEDSYILEYFKKCIEYTGNINKYTNKNNDGANRRPTTRLSIFNENFVIKLTRYGIFPVKSISHPYFKNIPKEFISSAILGYFDGDGSVSFSKKDNNRLCISIIGSTKFARKLLKELHKNNIKCSMRIRITTNGFKMGEIRLKGNNQCLNFYNYIYQSNIPSLKRKKDKFELVIEQQKLGLIKNTSK